MSWYHLKIIHGPGHQSKTDDYVWFDPTNEDSHWYSYTCEEFMEDYCMDHWINNPSATMKLINNPPKDWLIREIAMKEDQVEALQTEISKLKGI